MLDTEIVYMLATSLIAGICGSMFDLHVRDKAQKIRPAQVVTTLAVGVTMSFIAGGALCDYFAMKGTICLFCQTMISYLAIPILRGIKTIGTGFAKNPIAFIRTIKGSRNDGDNVTNDGQGG